MTTFILKRIIMRTQAGERLQQQSVSDAVRRVACTLTSIHYAISQIGGSKTIRELNDCFCWPGCNIVFVGRSHKRFWPISARVFIRP